MVLSSSTLTSCQVHRLIAPRDQKYQSNFVEFRSAPSASGSTAIARQNLSSTKIVYRRYAGLFFCVCVDVNDNELAYLEAIHFFVEVLDQFFGNVCELDLVFNFYKVSRLSQVAWSTCIGHSGSGLLMDGSGLCYTRRSIPRRRDRRDKQAGRIDEVGTFGQIRMILIRNMQCQPLRSGFHYRYKTDIGSRCPEASAKWRIGRRECYASEEIIALT